MRGQSISFVDWNYDSSVFVSNIQHIIRATLIRFYFVYFSFLRFFCTQHFTDFYMTAVENDVNIFKCFAVNKEKNDFILLKNGMKNVNNYWALKEITKTIRCIWKRKHSLKCTFCTGHVSIVISTFSFIFYYLGGNGSSSIFINFIPYVFQNDLELLFYRYVCY